MCTYDCSKLKCAADQPTFQHIRCGFNCLHLVTKTNKRFNICNNGRHHIEHDNVTGTSSYKLFGVMLVNILDVSSVEYIADRSSLSVGRAFITSSRALWSCREDRAMRTVCSARATQNFGMSIIAIQGSHVSCYWDLMHSSWKA